MTSFGYARVSTREQNLDTQIEQLKTRKCDVIIEEKMTGATFKRPELERLLETAQDGDTIVVTRVDRLGRNTQQLLELVNELQKRNITLFVIELGMEVTHRNGKMFLTILSALAENERELLAEKRNAGLENAKRKGIKLGRKGKAKGQVELAIEIWKQGDKTIKEIEESTGVGKSILYREIKKRDLKREV
ncbi:recombinase family protein [Bacillus gaemokensis]|uniref:Transposon resolvase n=1 Tax=Bacillus gaemokensis TaxID=574375 RepID=A0A073KS09_9BACI|nr:recombinase family protein [Bacillus gaemokensis]KEK25173.1 transposon resolvase [Bacillus gaemokensis]KYG37383.1 resolvase [Bacillus gaemokensis]